MTAVVSDFPSAQSVKNALKPRFTAKDTLAQVFIDPFGQDILPAEVASRVRLGILGSP